jgi:Immunity protein 50
MASIETIVENAPLLVRHFGEWPSFHDAEVLDVHCWRGRIKPGDWDDSNVMPVVTMKILFTRATDVAATFRFHDVEQITIDGFNHNNMIADFTVTTEERGFFTNGEKLPPWRVVSITRAFGMAASFRCMRIEVLDATFCLPPDEL